MTSYEAGQAGERALLKSAEFSHEQEVRIVTMSIKGTHVRKCRCTPMKPEDYEGAKMNNFENPGLYIQTNLRGLVNAIILSPNAPTWFELLVKRLVLLTGIGNSAARSQLE